MAGKTSIICDYQIAFEHAYLDKSVLIKSYKKL